MKEDEVQSKEQLLRLKQMELSIRESIERIEKGIYTSPKHALVDARTAAEAICRQVCLNQSLIQLTASPESTSLDKLIHLMRQHKAAPVEIIRHLRTIQDYGNMAAHSMEPISQDAAEPALKALSNLVKWYFNCQPPSGDRSGSAAEFPDGATISGKTKGWGGTAVAVGAAIATGVGGLVLGSMLGKRKKKSEPQAG